MSAIRIFSGFGSNGQNRRPEKVPMKPSRLSIMQSGTRLASPHDSPGGAKGIAALALLLAARKANCVFAPGEEGPRSEAEWPAPLETKFLLFRAGQRQDGVRSRSFPFAGTTGLVRFARPAGSTAHLPAKTGAVRRPPSSRERRPTSPAVRLRPPLPSAAGPFAAAAPGPPKHHSATERCAAMSLYRQPST